MAVTARGVFVLILFLALAAAACTNQTVASYNNQGGQVVIQVGDPDDEGCDYVPRTCIWTFTATTGVQRAAIEYLFEYGGDRLVFFDGNSVAAPRISTATLGSYGVQYVGSTGKSLTVRLETDFTIDKYGGFRLTVSRVANAPQHCNATARVITYTTGSSTTFNEPVTQYGLAQYAVGTCRWLLYRAAGDAQGRVQFDLDELSLAPGDALWLYDGASEAAPLITVVGYMADFPVAYFSAPVALMVFVAAPGDKLGYTGPQIELSGYTSPVHCSGRQVVNATTTEGLYSEPNEEAFWDVLYPPELVCEWEIWAPAGQIVRFQPDVTELCDGGATVTLYDGPSTSSPLLLEIMPDVWTETVSTGNAMLVRFASKPQVPTGYGTRFYITAVDPPAQCSGTQVISANGDVASPMPNYFNAPTAPNLNCVFNLVGTAGQRIYLGFQALGMDSGDQLVIQSLDDVGNTLTVSTLSGISTSLPTPLNVLTRRAVVTYTTGPTQSSARGFWLSAEFFTPGPMCNPTTTLNSANDLSFPKNGFNGQLYYGPTTCVWQLNAPSGYAELDIWDIDLAAGDYLVVRDGNSGLAPLMGNFTGRIDAEQYLYGSGMNLWVQLVVRTVGNSTNRGFDATFNVNGAATPYDPCSTPSNSYTRTNSDDELEFDSGDGHGRYITCTWVITNTDGGHLRLDNIYLDMRAGDTFVAYDGASTTTSPVLLRATSTSESFNSPGEFPLVTYGSTITLVYKAGTLYGGCVQMTVGPVETPDGPWCSGLQQVGNLTTDFVQQLRVTPGVGYRVQSNMRCQWLVDAANLDPNNGLPYYNTDYAIEIGKYYVWDDRTLDGVYYPGANSWAIYDGPNNQAPVLVNRTSQFFRFSSGRYVFVEFNSSAQQQEPSWGFIINLRLQTPYLPCIGYSENLEADPDYISSHSNGWDGRINMPMPRTCAWLYTAIPGTFFIMVEIDNLLANNEIVHIYDGPDPLSSPLLATLSATAPTPRYIRASGNAVSTTYATNGPSLGGGFEFRIEAIWAPVPCSGSTTLVMDASGSDIFIGTGFEFARPDADGDDLRTNEYSLLFPETPGRMCETNIVIPIGYYIDVCIYMVMPTGYVDIFNNGLPLGRFSGVVTREAPPLEKLCGNVTIRVFTGTTDEPINYWNIKYNAYNWIDKDFSIPLRCMRLDDIPCPLVHDYYDTPANYDAEASNCTLVHKIALGQRGKWGFPKLRAITGELACTEEWFTPGTLYMPALEYADKITLDYLNLDALEFPSLTLTHNLIICQMKGFSLIKLPVLRSARCISVTFASASLIDLSGLQQVYSLDINSNDQLQTIRSGNLTQFEYMYIGDNLPLRNIDLAQVQNFHRMTIIQCLMSRLVMPNVTAQSMQRGAIYLQYFPNLVEFSVPNTNGLRYLFIDQATQLFSFDISNVYYLQGYLQVHSSRVTSINIPNLQIVTDVIFDTCAFLSSVSMPKLTTIVGALTLTDSAMTELSLPSLTRIVGDTTLTTNYFLKRLDLCALERTANVTVGSCPALSCQETFTLFNATGAPSITANEPDCDPDLVGTFGCRENVTRTVSQASCGYSLACIQASIDASYYNKGAQVFIPAGTYTGCSSPLNALGKNITISGSPGGGTVIDCAGSGRVLNVVSGESAYFELRDIILQDGASTSGGLVYIVAGSPTFRRVTFISGTASGAGGAMSIVGAGTPSLLQCVFSNNHADSGGALSVAGANVVIVGGSFAGNVVSDQGGAILFSAPLGTPSLQSVSFTGNAAGQGGAIFSDGALRMNGCTLTANRATQFGGALAAAPNFLSDWTNISSSTFVQNTAPDGVAVYGFSANLVLDSCTMTANQATRDGGAISALCSPCIRLLSGILGTCDVNLVLTGTQIGNNTAGGNGGGVNVADSRLLSSGGSWLYNSAGSNGGALHGTDAAVAVAGDTFAQNSAAKTGGAMYCEPFTGSCDVRASSFNANTATVAGGAAFLCTAACPSANTSVDPALPPFTEAAAGNTFNANAVGATGYGALAATDAAQLAWDTVPAATVTSGRAISASGSISVRVTDEYGSLVTASRTLLAVSLELLRGNVPAGPDATIGGADTALATSGVATFNGVSLQAVASGTGATYQLVARLSSTVALMQNVIIQPCGAGEGRTDTTGPMYCADCAPGTAGSGTGDYVCAACPAGSFASTARATACSPCAKQTFAAGAGSAACAACDEGSGTEGEGATVCIPGAGADSITNSVVVPAVGASAGVLLLIIIGGIVLWRLARRKTMQKYYLDSDSTIRASGMEETPLMKSVKKILGAASTVRAGGGVFADVYKAKYENGLIALKVIKKEMMSNVEAQQEFRREAVALSKFNFRGIVGLVFFLERNPMCVGLEFCNNGTLKRMLPSHRLSTGEKMRLAAEAAAAMAVVHACGVVHLDLKTDNLLLDDDMHIKLADFGISRILDGSGGTTPGSDTDSVSHNPVFNTERRASTNRDTVTELGSGAGAGGGAGSQRPASSLNSFGSSGADAAFTPQYVDPLRIVAGARLTDEFLLQTDVFSFGIVMWSIFSQEEPYAGVAPEELIKMLRSNLALRPPVIESVHIGYERIMKQCWHGEPTARPTFVDVMAELRQCLRVDFEMDLVPEYVPDLDRLRSTRR